MNSMRSQILRRRSQASARRVARRHGAALVCVLICLSVVMMLLATMWKATLMARRQWRVEVSAVQTEWLVQAGIERAVSKLGAGNDYAGEIWELPAPLINGRDGAVIAITVVRRPEANVALVEIVAEFPRGELPQEAARSVRRTQQFEIQIDRSGKQEN